MHCISRGELTNTMPTAAQTKRLTNIKMTIIAIAGNGSFLRYGTRAWYPEALFENCVMSDGFPASTSSLPRDEGLESAILCSSSESSVADCE